jgi:hypothetical protein
MEGYKYHRNFKIIQYDDEIKGVLSRAVTETFKITYDMSSYKQETIEDIILKIRENLFSSK